MGKYDHIHSDTVGRPFPKQWIIGKTLKTVTMPAARVKAIREAHNQRKQSVKKDHGNTVND
jgi:hypothetical protein